MLTGGVVLSLNVCGQPFEEVKYEIKTEYEITVGAARFDQYLPILKDKKVGIVANHSSMIGSVHLVDTLLSLGVNIQKVFAPEHGFRGTADAGEQVKNYKDTKTGLPIISLYGSNKKPTPADLTDLDLVVFDIQDVGARFYTYTSTMHYMMEACAENDKSFLVLDRPNPNGYYVDGPVLEMENKSFIGMHPVALIHGMTVAEYATMINGEGWLANGVKCNLQYVTCKGYQHTDHYQLPVKPSPNLPNMSAVYLYPSLGLFEGTMVSVGRGTDKPFQIIGHPGLKNGKIEFTPKSTPGAKYPKFKNEMCYGFDLTEFGNVYMPGYSRLYLFWLMSMYDDCEDKQHFFKKSGSFRLLAGTRNLRKQIEEGKSEKEIRLSWQPDLGNYKTIRKRYLLYKDFE